MAVNNNRKIKRKVRNAYIISTVSIALVLFLLGAVGYLILGALNASNRLKENVSVFVMLKDGIPEETSAAVKRQLETNPAIREVKFIPKDQAGGRFPGLSGKRFRRISADESAAGFLRGETGRTFGRNRALSALEKQVMSWDGVDEVVYQRNVIEQVTSNINKFQPGAVAVRRRAADYFADPAEQYDPRYDFLETLPDPYDEAGRGHALVYYEAVPGRQYLAGNLCRADLVGDAGRDDRRAARRAAGGEVRFGSVATAVHFRGDDGGGYPHFAGVHRFRRS